MTRRKALFREYQLGLNIVETGTRVIGFKEENGRPVFVAIPEKVSDGQVILFAKAGMEKRGEIYHFAGYPAWIGIFPKDYARQYTGLPVRFFISPVIGRLNEMFEEKEIVEMWVKCPKEWLWVTVGGDVLYRKKEGIGWSVFVLHPDINWIVNLALRKNLRRGIIDRTDYKIPEILEYMMTIGHKRERVIPYLELLKKGAIREAYLKMIVEEI